MNAQKGRRTNLRSAAPASLVEVQQEWLKTAGSTYADENVRLMAIARKVAKVAQNGSL